jgi:hypothetical protein
MPPLPALPIRRIAYIDGTYELGRTLHALDPRISNTRDVLPLHQHMTGYASAIWLKLMILTARG